jgi:hypothetical protein
VTPRRRRDLQMSDIEATGESILLDPATHKATVLNQTATEIWLLCDGARDAEGIAREMLSIQPSLGVDAAALRGDIERVLGELQAEGLVG